MIQGVLFDMDGVLFNTERIYTQSEYEAAKQIGVPMAREYPTKFCGMNSKLINEILAQDYGPDFDVPHFRRLAKKISMARIEAEGLAVMPHVEKTLLWLRDNRIKTSVASSTKTDIVQDFLARAGFAPYFDAVVGGDQVENGKPHPDIFLFAAQRLGLVPQHCVAVEDSYNGIRSAFAAGCVPVMVPDMLPATDEMREKATAILQDLSFLPGFIQRLMQD